MKIPIQSRTKVTIYALAFLLTTPAWMQVAREYRDLYEAYSGTVIATGTDYFWFSNFGNQHRYYIILMNSEGKQEKRYLSKYTKFFPRVGAYVEKKKGFAEYPAPPGQKSYGELMREIETIKARKNAATSASPPNSPNPTTRP